jgi:hypothetical protein
MWWSFREAPLELRRLFPECSERAWLVHVPAAERLAAEPYLLRWQPVYPITWMELPDQSVAYCGAPEEALRFVPEHGRNGIDPSPSSGGTWRKAPVRAEYPSRYETHGEPKQTGAGHTLDWSQGEVSFTTENQLSTDTEVTLHVAWPIRLEGDVSVQLRARGKLSRADATKAALRWEDLNFSVIGELVSAM